MVVFNNVSCWKITQKNKSSGAMGNKQGFWNDNNLVFHLSIGGYATTASSRYRLISPIAYL